MSDRVTAIVLAAGAGTRMKSTRAKVLHELGGRSMVEHALRAVKDAGVDSTVAVVGHDREQVSAAITGFDASIVQAVQDEQRGTGHAVQIACATWDEPMSGTVVITYGDVPLLEASTIGDLVATHRAAAHAVTILTSEIDDPSGYGRIIRRDGSVVAIREHKDASAEELEVCEINSGILAVDAEFLTGALSRLNDDNAQGEYYLTDIVSDAVERGLPVGAHVLEDVWQTEGINDRFKLSQLAAELNARILKRWMYAGVTIIDPGSTWIDSAVELAPDVTIHPGTQLLGATVVSEGATIGPDTTLRNVEVGPEAEVIRTHGTDAVVGASATVGPFAYLRPGSVVGTSAKVGTFVETKNTTLGEGAKVPHLSYLGDATIGEGTNIGAGTITANYDGQTKSRTVVGKHAKTGSDNVFIAPVTIGDGAYTGAGSIIREDVPPGALGVSSGAQRNIEGWVASKRSGTPADEAAKESTGADDT